MSAPAATLETADISAILKALPLRFPFLMVDRIVNIRGDESAIGIKNVTYNEPQFVGHFPDNPVFPGVLLIEGMAQTAGAMCVLSQMGGDQPKRVYFLTIDKAKFRKPVIPGDTVEYHVRKMARKKTCGGTVARRKWQDCWSPRPRSGPWLPEVYSWPQSIQPPA
jgi:3-hydroxyacyl-[acyl-carrier-protein] dehydratase